MMVSGEKIDATEHVISSDVLQGIEHSCWLLGRAGKPLGARRLPDGEGICRCRDCEGLVENPKGSRNPFECKVLGIEMSCDGNFCSFATRRVALKRA